MINKIDFKAKNLTSNAGLFCSLRMQKQWDFDFIENDLVFDNDSTNKIKMNRHFIGIDKLERQLLQNDPRHTV
ncbi:Putative transposase (identified by ISEscan HMM) [Klebsiella pneumoniae]|nr:Putative transposase (identified by ISEscan HMM) [Klebsiella pneumoniae]